MTVLSTAAADISATSSPELAPRRGSDTWRGRAAVAFVWAGVACTLVWVGAIGAALYLAGTAVARVFLG
jgi:hypothetical protein